MKRAVVPAVLLLALFLAGVGVRLVLRARWTAAASSIPAQKQWTPVAAASYLDGRELWRQKWPAAQMDHGTVCISCHTVVPYALVRPMLGHELGEQGMTAAEKTMLASVEKRVTEWSEMVPFYSDAANGAGKTAESHATEAVLNAVILASFDAAAGHLRPVTKTAFDEAWELQETSGENAGGWQWQNFDLAPWESKESAYQGAALLAVALGNTPDGYAEDPKIRGHLDSLQLYLQRHYAAQPLMSQLYVLWASARMPALLSAADRNKLRARIEELQQPDGGWELFSLDEQGGLKRTVLKESETRRILVKSDGCATGLVVLALEESGMGPRSDTVQRGLKWLEQHQEKDGSWLAVSLNGKRDPATDIGRFMNDAATGYAVLALETARMR